MGVDTAKPAALRDASQRDHEGRGLRLGSLTRFQVAEIWSCSPFSPHRRDPLKDDKPDLVNTATRRDARVAMPAASRRQMAGTRRASCHDYS
jgi:hypothetical protein